MSAATWSIAHLRNLVLELSNITIRASSLWEVLSERILAATVTDDKPPTAIVVCTSGKTVCNSDPWLSSEQDAEDTTSAIRAWLRLLEAVCSSYIRVFEKHYVSDFLDLVLQLQGRLDSLAPDELDAEIQKLDDCTKMLRQRLRAEAGMVCLNHNARVKLEP